MDQTVYISQWLLILLSSLFLFWVAPSAKTISEFFRGSQEDRSPGFWLLTSSLVISWIFAKSITNAANLGLTYGIVGGVAYAAYYLSFLVAGITLYYLRVKGHFRSIHHFLETRFGRSAIVLFSILIAFRLLNEVWSNTMVIGSYFGAAQTLSYYAAILVFTLLTLAYTLKGGLSSSLLTDLIQMILFGVLLFAILAVILPRPDVDWTNLLQSGEWSAAGGINLLFVALLQIFSYPYHDPVMTDRAFIAPPKVTLQSFFAATIIGSLSIVLFSIIGVFGSSQGVEGQAAVGVSQLLGTAMMLMVNFIMVTSAASTLDSSFNSFGKLMVVDVQLFSKVSVSKGRLVIVIAALLGTLPIFLNASILSATTVSGTMVIGLTPVFLFWLVKAPPISFFASVLTGVAIGILHVFGFDFPIFEFTGPYADLLEANLFGVLLCTFLYFACIPLNQLFK